MRLTVIGLAGAASLLGGCAEMHHGVEAVGRLGGNAQADAAPVRPTGTTGLPPASAAAVPSPRQIFDFHPPGTRPDAWRKPFVIDTSDGPLAADVRRSSAELRAFLADQKAGDAKAAGTARPRCEETAVARSRPGCRPNPPRPAASLSPAQ